MNNPKITANKPEHPDKDPGKNSPSIPRKVPVPPDAPERIPVEVPSPEKPNDVPIRDPEYPRKNPPKAI